jgi:pSer/pThr/pTyr-binding forkhead associated (FHA) protein
MATITLRVLDGADRGRIFEGLAPPITIGREEGNVIQLNDDRVSRFHVKIQEDNRQLVLTDLESTNGTRVNGEDIQLRILRHGDLITVGRSVLLFGSRDEIAERLATLRGDGRPTNAGLDDDDARRLREASSLDFELNFGRDEDLQATLHVLQPPEVPRKLTPGQAAQLAELIEYLHLRIRRLLESVKIDERPTPERVTLDMRQWQNLIDLQARLSAYLHDIGNPDDSASP